MKKKYNEPKIMRLGNIKMSTKAAGGLPSTKNGTTQDQGSHAS